MPRSIGCWTPSSFMFFPLWLSNFHLISLCHRVNCSHLGGLTGDSLTNTTRFSTLIPSQVLTVPLKRSTSSTWSRLPSLSSGAVTRRHTLQSRSRCGTPHLQGALLFPPSWRLVYLSTASPHCAAHWHPSSARPLLWPPTSFNPVALYFQILAQPTFLSSSTSLFLSGSPLHLTFIPDYMSTSFW